MNSPARAPARGGFGVGLVVGLLIGLGVALGVALYITKAPVPFVDKLPQRTAAQDAAEAERNKNWDPNAPLAGKTPARPASGAASAATPAQAPAPTQPAAQVPAQPAVTTPAPVAVTAPAPAPVPAAPPVRAAASAVTARDAAALLGSNPAARPGTAPAPAASAAAAQFYVQAGAYSTADDAEAQRARLAMQGHQAKVMAREQSGRTVYRVRLGPFDSREGADDLRDKLGTAGVESTLVRVER